MYGGGSQNGGGFFDTTAQFDSPSDGKKDTNVRKAQNLMCASVQQILSSQDDSMKIGRVDANLLRLVARVKAVEASSTKIKYELEDDTGTITAISWLDGDSEESGKGHLVENTYCRVVGSVRSQEGRRHIMLLQAEPLLDANLLTAHLLGVMHNELMASKPATLKAPAPITGSAGTSEYANVKLESGSSKERILQYIQGFNSNDSGVNRNDLYKEFSNEMNARQIDEALEFFCNEGQIYTTVDDDHFKSTE